MIKDYQESFVYYNKDIPIIVQKMESAGVSDFVPEDMLVHWHEDLEILRYKTSGGFVYVGGEIIEPQAGDIIIINPLEIHNIMWGKSKFEYDYFIISPTIFAASEDSYFGNIWGMWSSQEIAFCHRITGDTQLNKMLSAIVEEFGTKRIGYEMIIKGILNEFVGILQRRYTVSEEIYRDITKRSNRSERLRAVFQYVKENYREPIKTERLAREYGSSEEHFCRIFRKITRTTPNEYITRFRIVRAEELLLSTDMDIVEIASECGFSDANYFSRVFKKVNGIPPTKFRKLKKFS